MAEFEALRKKLDQADMWSAIKGCPEQITYILEDYRNWSPSQDRRRPARFVLLGMGGSAIGGDLVRIWVEAGSPVPMMVLRGYQVPRWVDREAVVVASSYSGNTEETLSAVAQAAAQGARIVAISSGGRLMAQAAEAGWDRLVLPVGLQPRAAIGYSVTAVALVAAAFEVLDGTILDELAAGAQRMAAEGERWGDPASTDGPPQQAAGNLHGHLPVIYGTAGTTEALALRFRGQLAENSKMFASHHLLPEQNHNEIVGVRERLRTEGDMVVVWLEDPEDHPRVRLRREIGGRLMEIRESGEQGVREIRLAAEGNSLVQRNLVLLHLIDWISYYTAMLNGQDPSRIEVLMKLKEEMQGR